jgi:tetratricopeptide (TPR) repeat protein
MKRNISLWLGVLAFALMPSLAQQAPQQPVVPMAKVHGHVTNPSGAPQSAGTVNFLQITHAASGPGLSPVTADKGTFTVDANGDYKGDIPAGNYIIIYRSEGMAADKQADRQDNVNIPADQDTTVDFDMSRQAYIDTLPPEVKKQLEEIRQKNAAALKANEVIKNLNADLKTVTQDVHEADAATATAAQQLGASASKPDIAAKAAEIKTAKYTEIETLMTKDTAAKPDASVLWAQLGLAQNGLKKYDDALVSYKKALDVDAASKKPNPAIQGMANAGMGEAYARTGKVPEANAAYDAAAKANPPEAGFYLRNEAVIFFQTGNADAQVAAANEAIAASPNDALLYYLKGQGLVSKATIDPKTQRIVLPDGCADAYQKYLELAPDGPYAADAKGILDQAGQKINSSYKATKTKK